uniref:Predicted protein n=1 Tax=Hordeum vulgare subsp. vulgare TaxID=112509 RepID=F2DL94_HORVV|nr:predicted protein [Hordeum vulgare subsp. vulgare]BAJ98203.1 predicted protein [Hordeum vulgare subsp. vulgare]BAK02528.1 predicted protein [Hordeum vulgare subsp. vulgare]
MHDLEAAVRGSQRHGQAHLPLLADQPPRLLPLYPPPQPAGPTAAVVVAAVPGRFRRERDGARRRDGQERRRRRRWRQDSQGPVHPARAPAAAGRPAVLRRRRPPTLPRLQAPPVQAGPPRRGRLTPAAPHLLCFAARSSLVTRGERCASISRAPTLGSVYLAEPLWNQCFVSTVVL